MPPRTTITRLFLRTAAFLTAGAARSLTIAWVLSIVDPRMRIGAIEASFAVAKDQHDGWWYIGRGETMVSSSTLGIWHSTESEAADHRDYFVDLSRGDKKSRPPGWENDRIAEFTFPDWSAIQRDDLGGPNLTYLRDAPARPVGDGAIFHEVARGWPFCCVRGSRLPGDWHRPTAANRTVGLLMLGGDLFLPYRPIPLPLTANTLLYAATLVAASSLLTRLRAASRRRRGLCPRCAYSREGLPPTTSCPECGASPKGEPRA